MSNKRDIKKQIAYTCGELAAATLYMRDYVEGVDTAKANAIIGRIADLQCNIKDECSFAFDKAPRDYENKRAYRKALRTYTHAAFNKIHTDFNKRVAEIVKDMNALVPADQRKEALA